MRRLWLVFALAGCASAPVAPVAEVERVILYRDTVNVLMSDGSLCVVDRPGRAVRWSGVTAGCPHRFDVMVNAQAVGPRQELRRGGGLVSVGGQGWG